MNELYEFVLSKGGVPMGNIRWHYDSDVESNCRLVGDEAALAALQASMAQAVAEKWSAYLPPSSETVSDPLNSFYEMMIVLERGGYDIPEAFYPYTPKGSAERDAEFEDGGGFFICH